MKLIKASGTDAALTEKVISIEQIIGNSAGTTFTIFDLITSINQAITTIQNTYATLSYTNSELNNRVNKLGDTVSGNIELLATPVNNNHLVTRGFVTGIQTSLLTNITNLQTEITNIQTNYATKTLLNSSLTSLQTDILTLTNLVNSLNSDTVTRAYVDTQDATRLSLSGGTMTGLLTLAGTPLNNLHAATKQYVDTGLLTKLNTSGGTLTNHLTLHSDPVNNLHAVTKQYVDKVVSRTLPAGTVIVSALNNPPEGFLRCNGGMVPSVLYPKLCEALSDKTNIGNLGAGKHWVQQYSLNLGLGISRLTFVSSTNLPANINDHRCGVIDNDNIIIAGGNNNNNRNFLNTVTMAFIDTTGLIRSYVNTTALPISVASHELIIYGNYVYIIGGLTSTGAVTSVFRSIFNTDTKALTTWELVSTLPYPVFNHSAVILNDRIYVFGGNISSSAITDSIICANIFDDGSLGTWSYAGVLPMLYRNFSIAITKNKLYLIGGNTSPTDFSSVSNVFSTNFNLTEWVAETDLPAALCHGRVVVTKNMAYLIGVFLTDVSRNIYTAVIDEAGNISPFTLSTLLMPTAMSNTEIVVTGSRLHCIGGFRRTNNFTNKAISANFSNVNNNFNFNINRLYFNKGDGLPDKFQYRFNDNSNTFNFTEVGTLPLAIHAGNSIVTNNRVFILGASPSLGPQTDGAIYSYTLNADGTLGTVSILTGPTNLKETSVVMFNRHLYMIGGNNSSVNLNTVFRAQMAADGVISGWTSLPSLPFGISNHVTLVIKNKIYIFGGVSATGVNRTILYATATANENISQWSVSGSMPLNLINFKAVYIKDRVYILGGTVNGISSNKVYFCTVHNDGSLGVWVEYTPLPVALHNFSIVTTSKFIYIIGGTFVNPGSTIYQSSIGLDGSLTQWQVVGNLPVNLSNTTVSIVNNNIYLFGGFNGSSIVRSIYRSPFNGGRNNYISNIYPINSSNIMSPRLHSDQYQFNNLLNVNVSSFVVERTLPVAISNTESIVTNNRCYVMGGVSSSGRVSTIYESVITDGKLSNFTTAPVSLPAAISNFMSVVLGDKLFIIGGITTDITSRTEVFVTTLSNTGLITSAFTAANSLPVRADSGEVIVTGSMVYVLGGNNNNVATNAVYSAEILSDNMLGSWTTNFNLPVAMRNFKAVYIDPFVYLIGGNTTSPLNTVYVARVNSDGLLGRFTLYGTLPEPLESFQLVSTNSRLFIIGGQTTDGTLSSNIYIVPIRPNGGLGTNVNASNVIEGIILNPSILTNNVTNSSVIVTSNTLYLIGGNNPTLSIAVSGALFNGGRDNYLHNQFNIHPPRFRLPNFDNTSLDVRGYNLYIKH